MKATRRLVLGAALAIPAVGRAQEKQAMLEDLARRATIYLFPVYEMYRTRWNATVNDKNPVRGKLNRFLHVPVLATSRSRADTKIHCPIAPDAVTISDGFIVHHR